MSRLGIGTHTSKKSLVDILPRLKGAEISIIDTAPNYRGGWCHKVIGQYFRDHNATSKLMTKVGGLRSKTVNDRLDQRYSDEETHGFVLNERYVREALLRSKRELTVEPDVTFVHNFEVFYDSVDFEEKIKFVIEALEFAVSSGLTKSYGFSTWNAFVKAPYLEKIYSYVTDVAGKSNNFSSVQLPISISRPEALIQQELFSSGPLNDAREIGVSVYSSSPFDFGRIFDPIKQRTLCGPISRGLGIDGEIETDEVALRFLLSVDTIDTILVGVSTPKHLDRLNAILDKPRLDHARVKLLLQYFENHLM